MQSELATKFHDQATETGLRDLLLNALTVSSGAVDAISFLALGKVYSAFMTGNIAFLGLRAPACKGEPLQLYLHCRRILREANRSDCPTATIPRSQIL